VPQGVSVMPEPSSTLDRPKSQILTGVSVLLPNTRFSGCAAPISNNDNARKA